MSATTVASDLRHVGSDEVVVRVLLTTGQTIQGTQPYVREDGLFQMQGMDDDALGIVINPAHIIASYVPATEHDPNPWV